MIFRFKGSTYALGKAVRMNRAINALKFILILMCSAMPGFAASECPSAKPVSSATVVGFAGWTMPMTTYHGSAVEQIIDRLRARGMRAEVHPPEIWPEIAQRLVANQASEQPIILVGFSMGAAAAVHVAQTLGAAGIPVSKIVVVEAWNPEAVPANVGAATHFYSTGWASEIKPGPGNTNTVENIDLKRLVPEIRDASHVDMSRMVAVQDIVTDEIEKDAVQKPVDVDNNARRDKPARKSRGSSSRCANAAPGH